MSWIDAVKQLEQSGQAYVLVTVLGARGSTPREGGTKMVVCNDQLFGTIGGGHLEYQSVIIATEMLKSAHQTQQRIEHFVLGASLGQCCGGSVSVLFESFPASAANIMVFGAGHVGRALISILSQLPCRVRWVDSREFELESASGQQPAANIEPILSDTPAEEVASMVPGSYYVIMTHNHPMDFDITEAVLKRGDAAYVGLIGSTTKWQRFKMRWQHRGYQDNFYQAVHCPVGLSSVPGKQPMEVAVSIAGQLIACYQQHLPQRVIQRGISWRELKSVQQSLSSQQCVDTEKTRIPEK